MARKNITDATGNITEIIDSIVQRRNELGLSQAELGDLCGMPQCTVGRIEARLLTPNLNTLVKVFDALQLRLVAVENSNKNLITKNNIK